MGYTRREELGNQGEKRVIGVLTLTNIAGGLAGLAILWLITGAMGIGTGELTTPAGILRLVLTLGGGGVGVFATFRWSGLSLLDRVLLWGSYQIRRTTGSTLIKPPVAIRQASATTRIAPLMQGGRIVAEAYDPTEEATHE